MDLVGDCRILCNGTSTYLAGDAEGLINYTWQSSPNADSVSAALKKTYKFHVTECPYLQEHFTEF
jgi:hypothetical protein